MILLGTDHLTLLKYADNERVRLNDRDFEQVPGLRVENWLE